jgi:hypothetical protein
MISPPMESFPSDSNPRCMTLYAHCPNMPWPLCQVFGPVCLAASGWDDHCQRQRTAVDEQHLPKPTGHDAVPPVRSAAYAAADQFHFLESGGLGLNTIRADASPEAFA